MMFANLVNPTMMVFFFERHFEEMLDSFAKKLECSPEELTVFFQSNKKKELVARVAYNKRKVEDVPVLAVFEQVIKGVFNQVPAGMKEMVGAFQSDFGKDLDDAFDNAKATNKALTDLIGGDKLIAVCKGDGFVYAHKKKEGGKPVAIRLEDHLTKENYKKLMEGVKPTA
ncbi:MAG: hypothetical protein ACRBFS_21660 [Aureispira sp.]